MVKVKKTELGCGSCDGGDGIPTKPAYAIVIGYRDDESDTHTIRLCRKCMMAMIKQANKIVK